MGDTQKTDIKDSSKSVSDSALLLDAGATNSQNALGGFQATSGAALTVNSIDAATVKNALDSNAALVSKVLDATSAFQDKSAAAINSTVQANNALSTGTLTTLRDALSSSLNSPSLAGDAANSGAGLTTWIKANPALAAALALGVLLILRPRS
ncbi:MAG TPA: hypothetical protein VL357_01655 [Rariglobus sp.]|nr:hypothetical protein [Rariglobus sp.]